MCVISVCIDNKPTWEQVAKMHEDNSHGCSITWLNEKGKAQYIKGLNDIELYRLIQTTELPFVLHFRQSSFSYNKENKLLNHPFEIVEGSPLRLQGEADKLLIHNGTIKEYELMLAAADVNVEIGEPMSDTRAIAMIMAKGNDRLPWRIPGKYVVVDAVKKSFRINNKNDFTLENGIIYSNMYWKNRWVNKDHLALFAPKYEYNDIEAYVNDAFNEETDQSEVEHINKNQKKKTQTQNPPATKQEAAKKTKGIGKGFDIIKLDKTMPELQYNAGGFYFHGNESDYNKAGMKERRKWWHGFYPQAVMARDGIAAIEETKITRAAYLTEYKCCKCYQYLYNFSVNTMMALGRHPREYMCGKCYKLSNTNSETIKKSEQVRLTAPLPLAHLSPKVTRNNLIPYNPSCI